MILSKWKKYLGELPIICQVSKCKTAALWMKLTLHYEAPEVNFEVTCDDNVMEVTLLFLISCLTCSLV